MATLFKRYTKDDRVFIANLKNTYRNIENLQVFNINELYNIRVGINKFFDEFRFWNFILKNKAIKIALFQGHYHREGFILALRRHKIASVELQHGLIANEDIFYIFPPIVKTVAARALFPDKIFTYGSHWAELLRKGAEFRDDQIDVLGVYQELNNFVSNRDRDNLDKFLGNDPMILITTQTFLHEEFIEYIIWLSNDLIKKSIKAKIVVKNHPSEKSVVYQKINSLKNVKLVSMNTEYLLSRCIWHVSCYSTTLYDATRHRCKNFSLLISKYADYVESFVKSGISALINKNENPVEIDPVVISKNNTTSLMLYEDFEYHKHKLSSIRINNFLP